MFYKLFWKDNVQIQLPRGNYWLQSDLIRDSSKMYIQLMKHLKVILLF